MPNTTQITIVGNVGADPELRFTPSRTAVVNFNVAVTPRYYNADKDTWVDGNVSWYHCTAWRDYAENIAGTIAKGDRVIVLGELDHETWDDKDGVSHIQPRINVHEIGKTLRFANVNGQTERQTERQPQRSRSRR